MKFWEAMKALQEGKKVRGNTWNKDEYLDPLDTFEIFTFYEYLQLDWEIYDDTPKLNFQQVIEGLKQGKKFKRVNWEKDCYIKQNNGLSINLYFVNGPNEFKLT